MKNNIKFKIISCSIVGFCILIILLYINKYMHDKNKIEIIDEEINKEYDFKTNEEYDFKINEEYDFKINNIKKDKLNKIIIHITGEVKYPGVVELPENSRIVDAIEAAGGESENANLNELNLAYILSDGEKIYIPNKYEDNINVLKQNEEIKNQIIGKININKASKSELMTLPGIGDSTANKIIEYREKQGRYSTIEELKNVPGIGDSKLLKLKELIIAK